MGNLISVECCDGDIYIDGLHNKFIISEKSGIKHIIVFFFDSNTGRYAESMNVSVKELSWRDAIEYALCFDYDINSKEDNEIEVDSDYLNEIYSYLNIEMKPALTK